jgi:hypothetical protein
MNHALDSIADAGQTRGLGEIGGANRCVGKRVGIEGQRPPVYQKAKLMAAGGKMRGHVRTQIPRRPGNEDFHASFSTLAMKVRK